MNKIIIIFFAVIFLLIGGCQKKNNSTNSDAGQTNDFYTEIIKEDILSNNNNTNMLTNTNGNMTEPIVGATNLKQVPTVAVSSKPSVAQKQLPVEPEVGTAVPAKKNPAVKSVEKQVIRDEGIEAPAKSRAVAVNGKGSYMKIGNDSTGQSLSPRKRIKVTAVAFTSAKQAKYADFDLYAIPKGREAKAVYYFQICSVNNVEVINGQAQLTKYWNGKNVDGEFLPQGNYNIYMIYHIKDARMGEIKIEKRYWGLSDKFYLKLY